MGNLDFSANADQLKELATYMASQINVPTIGIGGGYAPIGTINFFDATVAPQDWLACDGSVYNIADYPQLAEWYATQHGASNFYGGNGTTTFAVPDLQGEFLRGTGTNSHANQGSGANVGVHQDGTEFPFISSGSNIHMGKLANGVLNADAGGSATGTNYASPSGTTQWGSGFTSRPTNTSFLICVKAVVAGEVYSTEERVGGTWIDGKKLYQKTYSLTNISISANSTVEIIDLSSLSIDNVANMYAVGNENGNLINISCANCSIYINSSKKMICGGSSSWDFGHLYVTVKYTKTTDG